MSPQTPTVPLPRPHRPHESAFDIWPRHILGMISPAPDATFIYYQFYQAMPRNCLLVAPSIRLGGFSAAQVDAALESFWPVFESLLYQGAQRITLGGVPLSAYAGRPRILELLKEARKRTDVPVTVDFEDCIEAFRLMNAKRIATAAKWDPTLMQAVRSYLEHAGLQVDGEEGEAHTLEQVLSLRAEESVDVAVRIGIKALEKSPDADALLLGGGGWMVLQAVEEIERRTGRPVVSNTSAIYWGALRQFGLRCALPNAGKLMEML